MYLKYFKRRKYFFTKYLKLLCDEKGIEPNLMGILYSFTRNVLRINFKN